MIEYKYKKINKEQCLLINTNNPNDYFKFMMNKINKKEKEYLIYHSSYNNPIIIGKSFKKGITERELNVFSSDIKLYTLTTSSINRIYNLKYNDFDIENEKDFLIKVFEDNTKHLYIPYLNDVYIINGTDLHVYDIQKKLGYINKKNILINETDLNKVCIIISLFYFLDINTKWDSIF